MHGTKLRIVVPQERVDLRRKVAGMRLDLIDERLSILIDVDAFVEIDHERFLHLDRQKQIARMRVTRPTGACAADADPPEARHVARRVRP